LLSSICVAEKATNSANTSASVVPFSSANTPAPDSSPPATMPGASVRTRSQRTAPRWWCARTLEIDGEQDRRHRRRDRHLDRQHRRDPLRRQQQRHERDHDHAAADAEQPGQETGETTQDQQLDDEQPAEPEDHSCSSNWSTACHSSGVTGVIDRPVAALEQRASIAAPARRACRRAAAGAS
jgi:hypothetical protein